MKIIISPAKKLTSNKIKIKNVSTIKFKEEAKFLIEQLRDFSCDEIKNLMSLSNDLAKLNYNRFQSWDLSADESFQSIFMFQGDVYRGLCAHKFSDDELLFAQNNLRILSGLYGILKPFDVIYPYRLEMGTKFSTKKGKNLYEFWGDKLTNFLLSELKSDEIIVNLASNEYSKVLKLENFKHLTVNPIFKDYKNGKLKIISFFAKRARGEMANFIIKNKITDFNELKLFSGGGYSFAEHDQGNMLFVR